MSFFADATPQKGLVSIITPFRNAEPFLEMAIESVRTQCYRHWELLLVNDDSSDAGLEIAESYAQRLPHKIRVINPTDGWRGAAATRNTGLRLAKGEFITFLDSDDVYLPHTLETEVGTLVTNPEAGGVCGAMLLWYSWTGKTHDARRDFMAYPKVGDEWVHSPPHLLVHNLRSGGRKPGIGSLMIRRQVIEQVGAFEEDFRNLAEDQIFWAKVCLHVPIVVLDNCLFRYRQHQNSLCAKARRDGSDFATWQAYLDWLMNYLIKEGIEEPAILQALLNSQRSAELEARFSWLKQAGRRIIPPRTRFWFRDFWMARQTS